MSYFSRNSEGVSGGVVLDPAAQIWVVTQNEDFAAKANVIRDD